MAKVYDYKGITSHPVLLEDPRVTSNEIYFFGWLHDKNSLSPVFNAIINTGQIGASYASFSGLVNSIQSTAGYVTQDQLFLKKQTVHVHAIRAAINTQNATNTPPLDNNMWWTLDPSYNYGGNIQELFDGTSRTVMINYGSYWSSSTGYRAIWPPLSNTTKLSDSPLLTIANLVPPGQPSKNQHYIRINPTSKLVYGFGAEHRDSNYYHNPTYGWLAGGPTYPSSMSSTYRSITNLSDSTEVQFIGLSLLDNNPLFILIRRDVLTAATTVQKVAWNSTTPTVTQMYTITSAISAGGTNAGGNRMAGNYYPASCSQWFTDPRVVAETTKCWYYPYFDSSRNFHPILYTWNQTNDTFNRETDITITGDLSSVHADMTGLSSYSNAASIWITANMCCHTFVNNSNRYVMFINIDGRDQYPTTPGPRTSVVYAVNASNPKALTYHSKIVWPDTPKNFVFLNDDQTLMGMFFTNTFKLYAWNNSTGWQETVSINTVVTACGRDGDGRIWYVQTSTAQANTAPELHILTPSLPVSITINPEFASYDYAGTPINSYINVSAYNASGNRIAADVKLVINGGSMTFSDTTTVKTVTTLTNAEKQQNIIITGAGFSNITASVEI